MKKIIAFVLALSMIFSLSLGTFAEPLSKAELKQVLAGIFNTNTAKDEFSQSNGKFGLDDVYQHTSPLQKAQTEKFSKLIIDNDGDYIDQTLSTTLGLGTIVTNLPAPLKDTLTAAELEKLIQGFADAMTFPRESMTPIKYLGTAPTPGAGLLAALDQASLYETLDGMADRFTQNGPADVLDEISDETMNVRALGAFVLQLRTELMKLAKDPANNIFATFAKKNSDEFVADVKNTFLAKAAAKVFDNADKLPPVVVDRDVFDNLVAARTAMLGNGMLKPKAASTDIDPDSVFIQLLVKAFDYIIETENKAYGNANYNTAATVANIILCGVLDNYATDSAAATASPANAFRPNDGLNLRNGTLREAAPVAKATAVAYSEKYNTKTISIPITGTIKFKIYSEAPQYGVAESTPLPNQLDLTSWLVVEGGMNGVTISRDGGYIVLTAPNAVPTEQPVLRLYRNDSNLVESETNFPIDKLYMEIGLNVYVPQSGGGPAPTTPSTGGSTPVPPTTAPPTTAPPTTAPPTTTPPTTTPPTTAPPVIPQPPEIITPPGGVVTPGTQGPITGVGTPEHPEVDIVYTITPGTDPNDAVKPDPTKVGEEGNFGSDTILDIGNTDVIVDIITYDKKTGEILSEEKIIYYVNPLLKDEPGKHEWYLRGYTDGTLRPNGEITRAEVVTAIYRLLVDERKAGVEAEKRYTDVEPEDWYGLMITTLSKLGIVMGYDDGSFLPNKNITRAELATMLSRFYGVIRSENNPFSDIANTDWAYKYIISAFEKKIVTGYANDTFMPDNNTLRCEFAAVINRLTKRKVNFEDLTSNVLSFPDLAKNHWAYLEMCEAINTHDYVRKTPDDVVHYDEIWSAKTEDGIDEVYNK